MAGVETVQSQPLAQQVDKTRQSLVWLQLEVGTEALGEGLAVSVAATVGQEAAHLLTRHRQRSAALLPGKVKSAVQRQTQRHLAVAVAVAA